MGNSRGGCYEINDEEMHVVLCCLAIYVLLMSNDVNLWVNSEPRINVGILLCAVIGCHIILQLKYDI